MAPTQKQMLCAAVPWFGFGFMDNTVMILAGDFIDASLGVKFGLATLTAAGMGQVLSDTFGVLFGDSLEAVLVRKFKIKPPEVNEKQRKQSKFRYATTFGQLIGVILGCFAGMIHLLYLDFGKRERLKTKELDQIWCQITADGPGLFDAEAVSLFLHDPKDDVLWTKFAIGSFETIIVPISKGGVCVDVFKSKRMLKVENAYEYPRFNKQHDSSS
eukprot:UN28213